MNGYPPSPDELIFIERNKKVTFASTSIETIEESETDSLDGLTLDDLGLTEFLQPVAETKEKDKKEDIVAALNDFDFTF